MTQAQTIVDIRRLLPHASPYLLIDRIIDCPESSRLIAIKNVSITEPFFVFQQDEVPQMPVMVVIQAMEQAGNLLIQQQSHLFGITTFISEINKAIVKRFVYPGDQLRLEVELIKEQNTTITIQAKALVEGRVCAEAILNYSAIQLPLKASIHPTATVHPTAILGRDVTIGPYTTIGEHVVIGDRTQIEAHVMVDKWCHIGQDCKLYFGSVIGSAPQDIKYGGEKSWVVIGDRNEIREYVTINRATGKDQVTTIGSDNLFLTNVHIAHNDHIGSHVIIANMCHLGGHVHVEDRVTIGGITGIHQHARIGTGSMVGACSRLSQDVPPYMMCGGNPAYVHGINLVGLRRSGIAKINLLALKTAYKIIYRSQLNLSQAIEEVKALPEHDTHEIQTLLKFLRESTRGIAKKAAQDSEIEEIN